MIKLLDSTNRFSSYTFKKQTNPHSPIPSSMSQYLNKWKKKNVDSRLSIDNSVKNWSETERIESRLSPPEQKCLDPGQEGWNDIYIPRIWHPTRRWEFASRRNSRNNSLCGRAEGAAESGIRKDLVVFEKAPETRNRDIHGGGRGEGMILASLWRSLAGGRKRESRERRDADATRRDAAWRGVQREWVFHPPRIYI